VPLSDDKTTAPTPTYRAQQAGDGTWTIYDVPIFAVHVDDRSGGKPIAFTVKWLEKALKRGKTRHGEGYYPPLHISHHGDGEVEAAGRVRFTSIKPHPHGGQNIATLFADLVGVRPDVYQRIRKGELPYRSVEILDVDEPEIDSLALLDDEVPYFRFPLLKIGTEKRQRPTPMLAYSAAGMRASALFAFEEPMTTKQDEQAIKEEEAPTGEAPQWASAMMGLLGAIAKSLNVDLAEDEEEKEEEEEGAEMAAAPVVTDSAAAPLEVGVAEAMRVEAKQDTMAATVAALQAEIDDLKTKGRVETRAASLKEAGFSGDHVAKYRAIAQDKGETAAMYWADAMEEHRPVEPPPGFTGELAPAHVGIDCEAVRKYGNGGPDALERARAVARSYTDGIPKGATTRTDMSLEEWLEINMDTEAYFAVSRAGAGKGN